MDPNTQMLTGITVLAVMIGIVIILLTIVNLKLAVDRRRRGRFLDSLALMSLEKVKEAAEKLGFLTREKIFVPYGTQDKYPSKALGRFVESLLHNYPTMDNLCNVVYFLINSTTKKFRREFLTGMNRHEATAQVLSEKIREIEKEKREEKKEECTNLRFQEGLEMCGYHRLPLDEEGK